MLTIKIPGKEYYSEKEGRFYTSPEAVLQLEHSLVSLSKWESKWHIPFLSPSKFEERKLTNEQVLDYIRCMTLTKNVDPLVYYGIDGKIMQEIQDYISDPMTAATVKKNDTYVKGSVNNSGSYTTSETIYFAMFELNIPLEWEKRHLNRLLTLIEVCSAMKAQQYNPKKMSKQEAAAQRMKLHKARNAKKH